MFIGATVLGGLPSLSGADPADLSRKEAVGTVVAVAICAIPYFLARARRADVHTGEVKAADKARAFADEQITPRQKATLIAVYQRPGLSQNMLAEHLFMDRNTVAELVKRLVARHLLERRPSAGDRRAHELFLAPDGAAMLNRVIPRDASVEHAILQALPKGGEKRFMKYLRLIVQTPQS